MTYIIGICSSDGDDVLTYLVDGTVNQVKKHLVGLVKQDRKDDFSIWDGGSTRLKDLEVFEDGKIYGYASFVDHHIDYTATPALKPEKL